METIHTILSFIGDAAFIALIALMIRYVIIKIRSNRIDESAKILDYILALVKLKDQYRAYGFEAESKELDEDIKLLNVQMENTNMHMDIYGNGKTSNRR